MSIRSIYHKLLLQEANSTKSLFYKPTPGIYNAAEKISVDINVFIRYCPRQRINTLIIKTNMLCRRRQAPKMEDSDECSD